MVCTTLRPTILPHAEMYTWSDCSRFLADHIKYEPLDEPLLMSHRATIPKHGESACIFYPDYTCFVCFPFSLMERVKTEKAGKRVFTPGLKLEAVMLVRQGHTKAKVSRMKNQATPEEQIKANLQEQASICETSSEGSPLAKKQKLDEEVLDLSVKTCNQNGVKTESSDNYAELQRIRVQCGFNQQEVPAYNLPNLWQVMGNSGSLTPFLNPLGPLHLPQLNANSPFQQLNFAGCANEDASMTVQAKVRNILREVQPTYPGLPVFGYDNNLLQESSSEVHNRRFMVHPRKLLAGKRPTTKEVKSETMTHEIPETGNVRVSETSPVRDNNDRQEIFRSSTPIFKGYKTPKSMCSQQSPQIIAPKVADELDLEFKKRSLEERLNANSVEEFYPEKALQWGEGFLKEMQGCSNPCFTRTQLQMVEAVVGNLRKLSHSKKNKKD
ncbi:hypothetical protein HUJ04_013095 [Dendroctonus ponderosae]|nr:hypothetical protein HUJ04_013095 [Dendroctonus ponderosae]